MRKLILLTLLIICQLVNAGEDEHSYNLNQWTSFQAKYKIHSGGTAYSEFPTQTDSALSVVLRDEAAKQVFDQIGPDVKAVCDDKKGYRERRNKSIHCSYTPHLVNPRNSHYRCWIGIDLRTGEGDVRVSC